MWERKRTEELAPEPDRTAAAVRSGATAIATAPAFRAPEPARPSTAIGASISIVGDVFSNEDLFIDGKIRGNLEVKDCRVTIGPNGKTESNVKAREVIIQGDVEASQKITIKKDGSLVGNIKTAGIVIDDEAYFKGSIDIVRKPAGEQ
jgi:cytoskeletal protein CcmA (bactofilin family)